MAENGSNAAIREALKAFVKSVEWLCEGDERGRLKRQFGVLLSDAHAALSVPLRNCDVGTAEEQYKRFKKFCFDNMGDGMNEPRCSKCPLGKTKASCHFEWAQMPYEEGVVNG